MPLLRYLQHGLTGRGPCLQVADVVPDTPPLRQWAETFPWAAMVAAVDRSFAQRFPKPTTRGRPPVSTRVLWALAWLKHALACADEQMCRRLRTDLAVRYACGIREVQVDGSQAHVVRPEVLAQFRRRLEAPLMEERLAIQAATAMEDGLVSPAHLVVDTFPSAQGSPRVNDAATLSKAPKKVLQLIASIAAQGPTPGAELVVQAQHLPHDLQRIRRRFGRQCRGMGHVCVTRVRHTETQLLARGHPVRPLAQAVQARWHHLMPLSEEPRARLSTQLTAALEAHHRIAHPSRRLTQGQAVTHGKIVHAYDPTLAPIGTGKRNCPAQFGRKPGMIAEPAAGFIVAVHLPVGNPSDASSVQPLVDHVQQAIARVATGPIPAIRSLAGDLAFHEAAWREALHAQGMLTVGIPKTVDPLTPFPSPEDVLRIVNEAGLSSTPTPAQVPLACACG